MRVLLIGSGGREHALAWKLAQSPSLTALHAAPGSDAIAALATCHALDVGDHSAVIALCRDTMTDLVVIGPEAPLVAGLVDDLAEAGIAAFGPSAAAAMLEASKDYMKTVCAAAGVATADYRTFTEAAGAQAYLQSCTLPIVVKADGLAAGKGVVIAHERQQAQDAVDQLITGGSQKLVIESFLEGREASFFVLCDGHTARAFGSAEDHKAAYDGDTGPNTGGMGAYTPSAVWASDLERQVMATMIQPTLDHLSSIGTPYRGVLYAGLMLTADGPKLLEYNVRFGDPECQALMLRFNGDLLPYLHACSDGTLDRLPAPPLSDDYAATVVMAAKGYPGAYTKGSEIKGLDQVTDADTTVFEAGTRHDQGKILSHGGRVLNVTSRGQSLSAARAKAYAAVAQIDWPEGFYRHDIGDRGAPV